MIEFEKKLVTIQMEERSIMNATCDECSKTLDLADEEYTGCKKDSKAICNYVSLMTRHDDWGDDSCESSESHEFCSI